MEYRFARNEIKRSGQDKSNILTGFYNKKDYGNRVKTGYNERKEKTSG